MSAKTTVVLVHGAWADGSSWSCVIPLLQEAGFEVTAAQIPLTSLADDVAVTRRILHMKKAPVILVGHAYGGMVISEAAASAQNVTSLVYISAFASAEGETMGEISARIPASPGATPLRFNDPGFVWIDPELFPQVFAHDLDPVQACALASVQKPIAAKVFGERPGRPAWTSLRSWYLISEDDRIIAPDTQRFMAQRMGATVRTVAGSHASLISHAPQVAELIAEAAKAAQHLESMKAVG